MVEEQCLILKSGISSANPCTFRARGVDLLFPDLPSPWSLVNLFNPEFGADVSCFGPT